MESLGILDGICNRNNIHPLFSNRKLSIADFQVGKLLGKGGFGNVYEAKYPTGNDGKMMHLAIKIMDKQKIVDSKMTTRVRNEVEIHSALHHPSILRLYHFFEDAKNVYLLMEVCHNGELFKYMQARRKLSSAGSVDRISESEVRHVMLQIVRGIQYLHSQRIIHRDLKLSNILLTQDYDVKIADFGLAIRLHNPDGEQLTMCGTPNYISPEIIARMPYGLASDVWSIGCMFYTILAGKPPFESQAVKETLQLVSRASFQLPTDISEISSNLLCSMLQKRPELRITVDQILNHVFFKLPSQALKDISGITTSNVPPPTAVSSRVVSEPLPLINTSRLKSLKQQTKHGLVEILQSGHIVLDFVEDKYRILIYPDGKTINFFLKPINLEQWSISSRPTHSCSRETIPEKYTKKYRYAAKFVDVVKSKTPRIIFYSPQAKCLFMENNLPVADFDVLFYNGNRIIWHVTKGELLLREQNAKETKIILKTSTEMLNITSRIDIHALGEKMESSLPTSSTTVSWNQLWKHVIECYAQCWEISRTNDPNSFPLTLKSGATQQPQQQNSACPSPSTTTVNEENMDPNNRYNTRTPSVHVTDLAPPSTATVMAPSQFTVNAAADSRPFQRMDYVSRMSTLTSNQISTRVFDANTLNSSPAQNYRNAKSNGINNSTPLGDHGCVHLPKVGWCMRRSLPNGTSEFMIMFDDGCRIVIEPCETSGLSYIRYYDNAGQEQQQQQKRYLMDRNLPAHVKSRLSYFPRFLEYFRS